MYDVGSWMPSNNFFMFDNFALCVCVCVWREKGEYVENDRHFILHVHHK